MRHLSHISHSGGKCDSEPADNPKDISDWISEATGMKGICLALGVMLVTCPTLLMAVDTGGGDPTTKRPKNI